MFLISKNRKNKLNNKRSVKESAVSLISLIVTIIVLLILAAVTISISSGNRGIIDKTKKSVIIYENASVNESETMNDYARKLKTFVEVPKAASIKFTADIVGWTTKDVTITATSDDPNYEIELKSEDSDWSVRKDNKITVSKNQQINARLKNLVDKYSEDVATYNVTNIDKDAPDKTAPALKATTNSITVTFKQKDDGSGIAKREYSIDNGATWKVGDSVFTFSGLTQGKKYTIITRATDRAGNQSISDASYITTNTIPTPVRDANILFTATPTTKTSQDVIVTVSTTIQGFTLQTSTDGKTWGTTNPLTFTANGTAYARLWDGTNASAVATFNITNIDKTNYTISYNLNGGSASGNPTSYKVDTSTITINNPTRAVHAFLGWTGSNDISSGLENYTLSSQYVASYRDHILGNEFNVVAGEKYRVFVRGTRTKGNLDLQGGIWYTAQTSGAAYDGFGGSFTEIETGLFYKEITIPAGKTRGRFYIQLEQETSGGSTSWNLYDMHVIKVENPIIPTGSQGNKSYTANWVIVAEKARFDYVAANSSQDWIGKVQTYNVPYSGTYRITVAGAQGGWGWQSHKGMPTGTHGYPGYGAIMSQDVKLTKGQTIQVIVGRTGQNGYGQIKTHTEESKICWAQSGKSGWPYAAKTAAPYYADPDAQSIGGKGGYSQVTFPDNGFMKADGGGGGEGHGHDNIMGGGSVSAQAENCTTYSGGTNTQFNCASQRVFTTCNNSFNSTGGNGNVNNHNASIGRTGDKPSEDYQGSYTQANGYVIFELIGCD